MAGSIYGRYSIKIAQDASYQVSVHLAKRFQRRRFFLKISQSETRIACGSHVCKWIVTKCAPWLKATTAGKA
jgi:hypothetical protein